MLRRNGGVTKVVIGVVAFFGLVYFIYLYNDLSGQLKNTEHSAERYRREQESVSAQLQDQIIAKDELKQRCDNDKEQMTNRLNSIQQQYKMLKSQHEDMESEFGRLQNDKDKQTEDHKKQDEERAIEYSQLKQEKSLEISSLRDTVANLEREKEQLSHQVFEMKKQLQNSLDLLEQSQSRQQQIEQQYLQLQQQQQQQQQQMRLLGQQEIKMQDRNPAQGADIHGNLQPGRWPPGEMFQGVNQDQQQQQQPIGDILGQGLKHNVQDVLQGLKQQLPDTALGKIIHGGIDGRNPLVPRQPEGNFAQHNQDNFNVADDILKSLQDKHRPLDSNLLEEEQKRHQVMPPGNHIEEYGQPRLRNEPDDLGHQKHAQNMLGQDDLGNHDNRMEHQDDLGVVKEDEMHQIGKPNFDDNAADDTHGHGGFGDDLDTGAAADAGNHDNRMEHQGPVNLQVQEPNLHGNIEKSNQLADDDLKFRPHIEIPDNQIQPHIPVDDTQRQEQLDIPIGKDKSRGDDRNDNAPLANRNIADDDDDDDRARLPVLGRAGMI